MSEVERLCDAKACPCLEPAQETHQAPTRKRGRVPHEVGAAVPLNAKPFPLKAQLRQGVARQPVVAKGGGDV